MTENKRDYDLLIDALEKDGFDISFGEPVSCVDPKEKVLRRYRTFANGFYKKEGEDTVFPDKNMSVIEIITDTVKKLQSYKKSPMIVRPMHDHIISNEKGLACSYIRFYSELFNKENKND